MASLIDVLLHKILKYECPECYCSLVYRGQYHDCPVLEEDEGFEDGISMQVIVQKYQEGDANFFLRLLKEN